MNTPESLDTSAPRLSDLAVEQYALGELSEAQAKALSATHGAELERRVSLLREDDVAFFAAHPPKQAAEAIAQRIAAQARAEEVAADTPSRPWWSRWQLVAPSFAGAVAALILAVNLQQGDSPAAPGHGLNRPAGDLGPERIRLKGTKPKILVYRQASNSKGNERLKPGASARPGDLLQVAYQAGSSSDGVILSIDGRGSVTMHHPTSTLGSTALERGGEQPLPDAFRLDDAPHFERFVFVTGDKDHKPHPAMVAAAARALAADGQLDRIRSQALELPEGLVQLDFIIEKELGEPASTHR